MSCYRRQLRIRDRYADLRWYSKTVCAIPYLWDDSQSDHQVLYRAFENDDIRAGYYVDIVMNHFLGRRMKLFESRPFNYGHLYSSPSGFDQETDISSILSFPIGEYPNSVTVQVPAETDISTIQEFVGSIKKMLHL